jgi:hypothetical protein
MGLVAGMAYVFGITKNPYIEGITIIAVLGVFFYHVFQSYRYHTKDDGYMQRTEEARELDAHNRRMRQIHMAAMEVKQRKDEEELLLNYGKEHGRAMNAALPYASNVSVWIVGLETGHVNEVVTSDGSRYSFNNDGQSHYLELIDVTRREPNGRYKRVYKGKIEGGHVTHNRVTSELECLTEYQRWRKTPYGSKRRDEGSGEDARSAGKVERRDTQLAVTSTEWKDAPTPYIQ